MQSGVRKRTHSVRSIDRGPPQLEANGVFSAERIGPKRSYTPQGYLLCEDVPIARTGEMHYGPNELPMEAGPEGFIRVTRDEAELFRNETLTSFVGMPVTDDHPDDGDVSVSNWRERACGFVVSARVGEGEYSDCIVCDLLITDPTMIVEIDNGKREVSAGYDARYIELSAGRALQTQIMGNHVALVEQGRCGPRCAIGDSAKGKGNQMAKVTTVTKRPAAPPRRRAVLSDEMRKRLLDAINDEFGDDPAETETKDDEEMPPPPDKGDDGETHIHVHIGGESGTAGATPGAPGAGDNSAPAVVGNDNQADPAQQVATVEDRLVALETGLNQMLAFMKQRMGQDPQGDSTQAETAPPAPEADQTADEEQPVEEKEKTADEMMDEDEDASTVTTDSTSLATAHANSKASAELLFPGFLFPEFDANAPRKKTMDSICGARRKALDMAYMTSRGRMVIDAVRGSKKPMTLDSMTCAQANLLFRSAAGAMRLANTKDAVGDVTFPVQKPAPVTGMAVYDSMNTANRDFWASKKAPI